MRAAATVLGLAALCAMVVCGGCTASGTASTTPSATGSSPSAVGSLIPDSTRSLVRNAVDGGLSVGIVAGVVTPRGREFLAYGSTALEGGQPVGADTVFEIGSIGKVFTATLLADMAARGQVALDDPIERYLPADVKVPTYRGASIRLVDLATHSSGLPGVPDNLAPADELNPYADYSVPQLYTALSGIKLTGKPGSSYLYSNLGMGLLGHILCLRSGVSYEKLVASRITADLGMNDTRVRLTRSMRSRLATGYRDGEPMPLWDNPTLAGAGALRSTARDMLTFLAANLGLVDGRSVRAMRVTHAPRVTVEPALHVGLGWHIRSSAGSDIVECHGATGGYWAYIAFVKEARAGVVVLTNTYNDVDSIGQDLLWAACEQP